MLNVSDNLLIVELYDVLYKCIDFVVVNVATDN